MVTTVENGIGYLTSIAGQAISVHFPLMPLGKAWIHLFCK